jgi:hypothetical protein
MFVVEDALLAAMMSRFSPMPLTNFANKLISELLSPLDMAIAIVAAKYVSSSPGEKLICGI